MLYFSDLINAKVRDSDDEAIGKIVDIAIDASNDRQFPPIRGILARMRKGGVVFVSADKIASWGHDGVALKPGSEFTKQSPNGETLYVGKTVLDHQIVDLSGARVVRVNDLRFGPVHGVMCLLAIDVSTSGLMRRLGFGGIFLRPLKPHFLEWKDVHLIGDKLKLQVGREKLGKLHAADIANIIEKLNVKQGSLLLNSLDQATAAKVLEEIKPDIQKIMVENLGAERATAIMEKMSMDELVDLIQLLPARESREIVNKLPVEKNVSRVKKILEYDEDTAGGLMTTEFISAHLDTPVLEVIEKIKRDSHYHRAIHFVYVTDNEKHYLGVASLRRLIIADPHQKIKEIMKRSRRTPVVNVEQSLAEVASVMTKYNLLSVAVVDDNKRLLGIVTVDDIMRCLVPKA
jgi:CBS domain-containing protein/sporulation protein YlmC with PRC-barrel domain